MTEIAKERKQVFVAQKATKNRAVNRAGVRNREPVSGRNFSAVSFSSFASFGNLGRKGGVRYPWSSTLVGTGLLSVLGIVALSARDCYSPPLTLESRLAIAALIDQSGKACRLP